MKEIYETPLHGEETYRGKPTNGVNKMNKIRLQITLHPEELKILDELKKKRKFSRSSMMGILIREYKD